MDTPTTEALERFRGALAIDTVWPDGVREDSPEGERAAGKLRQFQDYLVSSYPAFHARCERHEFGPWGVAYRWAGTGSGGDPILLIAHYDVVPAEAGHWSVPPFSATVSGGFVISRGTLDTKNTLIGALEAAEGLASSGFKPRRDIWFAFGGDEERSGTRGAQAMAAWFASRGIRFEWLLDEGGVVARGEFPGVNEPIALIGVEEKGFLDLELIVRQEPGHASRPPKTQAVGVLARALLRLSKKPFPFALTPTVERFFYLLGARTGGIRGFAMRHARALGPLFFRLAAVSPAVTSFLRTTLAMTQLSGSHADNVLPSEAKAVLNLRLLPGWTVEKAEARVRKIVSDSRVIVRVSPERAANEPTVAGSRVARGEGPGWKEVAAATVKAFPDSVPVPYLVTATTDSRHYAGLCEAVYRFAPVDLDASQIALMHNHDERISLENFGRGIEFYRALIGAQGEGSGEKN